VTALNRVVGAGAQTAVGLQHTEFFHICKLVLPTTGAQFLSEGPDFVWTNSEGDGSRTYLGGRIRVADVAFDSDGQQTCTLDILPTAANDHVTWFNNNRLSNGTVIIWIVYMSEAGVAQTPVKYLVGSLDASELRRDVLRVDVIPTNSSRKFFPNKYVGDTGATHLPQEGTVVFWNNTNYVLELDY
jgi:hypothetical protein